eukprot:scaffold913_cov130-Skeletonema_menzelii.AAC.1
MNFSSKLLAAIIALAANSHHIIVSAANVSSRRRTTTTAEPSSPTTAGSNNNTHYHLFQQKVLLHDGAADDNYSSKYSSKDYDATAAAPPLDLPNKRGLKKNRPPPTGSPTATVTTSLSPTMVETTSIAPSKDEHEIEEGVTWPAGGPCMNEVFQSHGNNNNLRCTAKEVNTIATHVEGPLECIQGSTISVNLTISIDFHATRYDFHIYTYTGTQNGDPVFGESCALDHLTEENHLLNEDPENGVFDLDGDSCYDVVAQSGWSLNDYSFQDNLKVPCEFGGDGYVQTVHVQSCYGWRTKGQNSAANKNLNCDLTAAYPGSPSKCSCSYIDIGIPIILQPSSAPSSAPSVSLFPTFTPTTLPSSVPSKDPSSQPSAS